MIKENTLLFAMALLFLVCPAVFGLSSPSDSLTTPSITYGLQKGEDENITVRSVREAAVALHRTIHGPGRQGKATTIVYESFKNDADWQLPVPSGGIETPSYAVPLGYKLVDRPPIGIIPQEKRHTPPPMRELGKRSDSANVLQAATRDTFAVQEDDEELHGQRLIWLCDEEIAQRKKWPISQKITPDTAGDELTYKQGFLLLAQDHGYEGLQDFMKRKTVYPPEPLFGGADDEIVWREAEGEITVRELLKRLLVSANVNRRRNGLQPMSFQVLVFPADEPSEKTTWTILVIAGF